MHCCAIEAARQRPRRHGRAVLRPGLRVRGDAAVAHVAGAPHARHARAGHAAVPGRVVGVDVHGLDDQLARPRTRAGADLPVPAHHGGPVYVRRRSRTAFAEHGLAFAGAYVSMQVGRTLFVLWAVHATAPRSAPAISSASSCGCWCRACSGSSAASPSRQRDSAGGLLALVDRARSARWAAFWVPGLGGRRTRRLERRRRPHGRTLRAVHHHRAGRVAAGHRRDLRRADRGMRDAVGVLQRRSRHRR